MGKKQRKNLYEKWIFTWFFPHRFKRWLVCRKCLNYRLICWISVGLSLNHATIVCFEKKYYSIESIWTRIHTTESRGNAPSQTFSSQKCVCEKFHGWYFNKKNSISSNTYLDRNGTNGKTEKIVSNNTNMMVFSIETGPGGNTRLNCMFFSLF